MLCVCFSPSEVAFGRVSLLDHMDWHGPWKIQTGLRSWLPWTRPSHPLRHFLAFSNNYGNTFLVWTRIISLRALRFTSHLLFIACIVICECYYTIFARMFTSHLLKYCYAKRIEINSLVSIYIYIDIGSNMRIWIAAWSESGCHAQIKVSDGDFATLC